MKTSLSTPGNVKAILSLCFIIAPLLFLCCKQKHEDLSRIQVNPAFEKYPPIASEITIRQLKDNKDGNILVVANFGKQITDSFHAILLDQEKFVFRDDGQKGDSIARDGKFSLVMNEDPAELDQLLNNVIEKGRNQKEIISFDGRLMVRTPFDINRNFDIGIFKNGGILKIPLPFDICVPTVTVDKQKSLMITDTAVVNDTNFTFNPCSGKGNPNGLWSFGHLITEMANTPSTGINATDFLLKWLETWAVNQTVNSDPIAARVMVNNIINNWKAMSGGTLDIKHAPFRLLAIVNRMDLRGNSGYGFNNAGEGRFVFCAVSCSDKNMNVFSGPGKPFMVILEYGIPKKTCSEIQDYAKQWAALSGMALGTSTYNNALADITKQFSEANTSPGKPNGNSINQVRTNEIALGSPWEMREFNIDSTSHLLKNVTVKQEPQVRFNNIHPGRVPADVETMADFVNTNAALVLIDRHQVPEDYLGKKFLAGKSHILNASTYHWDGTSSPGPGFISSDNARFRFSLNTCSGCHGGDAFTGNFMQVGPGFGPGGVPARLSSFLTGAPPFSSTAFVVPDRANRPPGATREFNDLERRKIDLEKLASCGCKKTTRLPVIINALTFRPLNMTD